MTSLVASLRSGLAMTGLRGGRSENRAAGARERTMNLRAGDRRVALNEALDTSTQPLAIEWFGDMTIHARGRAFEISRRHGMRRQCDDGNVRITRRQARACSRVRRVGDIAIATTSNRWEQ